mmetsp:Transcript_14338/g.29931  ORF Transcript_14338/g.29931 Transcript_14338/m.29931 type:complete len:361 (+) Transcript_14338:386-1468(+)
MICVGPIAYESTTRGSCERGPSLSSPSPSQKKKRSNTSINTYNSNNVNTKNNKSHTTASHDRRRRRHNSNINKNNNSAMILKTKELPKPWSTPEYAQPPPRGKSKFLLPRITTAPDTCSNLLSVVSVDSAVSLSVSFDERVLVRPVLLNLDDYSEQEKRKCWLTRDDYRRIQTEALQGLRQEQQRQREREQRQQDESESPPSSCLAFGVVSVSADVNHRNLNRKHSSSIYASRGLERWSPVARSQSLERRRLALSAVLSEQEHQLHSYSPLPSFPCHQRIPWLDHVHDHPCYCHHHGINYAHPHNINTHNVDRHLVLCESRAHRIREAYQRHTIASADLARAMGKVDEKNAWGGKKTRQA